MILEACVAAAIAQGAMAHTEDCCGSCKDSGAGVHTAYNVVRLGSTAHGHHCRPSVDDVRRAGFNGREWKDGSTVGGQAMPLSFSDRIGAEFGAAGESPVLVVRAWPRMVVLNPFEQLDLTRDQSMTEEARRAVKAARDKWLADHGYTGGVRTFTNGAPAEKKSSAKDIQPRATIQLPPDATRFKSKMQVKAPESTGQESKRQETKESTLAVRVYRKGDAKPAEAKAPATPAPQPERQPEAKTEYTQVASR